MNSLVCVDASVAVKWLVPESDSALALDFYERTLADNDTIIVPPHMPVEVVNTIRRKLRRTDISPGEAERALSNFLSLAVNITILDGLYESAFLLAQRFGRPTVYDTHYVALAQLAACDFWTADRKLLNAFAGRLPFMKDLQAFKA